MTTAETAPDLIDDDFRYGQLAIEGRIITTEQFDEAMTRAKELGKSLQEILVSDKLVDQTTADRLTKAVRRIIRDERAKSEIGISHKHIGGYKIIRRIGEGGMGEVYLADQLNMHRQVALKVLHDQWVGDEEFRKRFLLEARAAGKLSHQNLIQVYDVGKYQGKYYFAMEFIDGVTAEDLIQHDGPLPLEKVLDISLQTSQALRYLSSQNIVHRDIKPANIMLTKDGMVKLGDFGFIQSAYDVELMQEGTTLGTPDYISPEQARGERNLDVRSDIYSLGATMFHLLTNNPLYEGSCSKVMRDHIDTEPPPLDKKLHHVSPEMRRVMGRMLAKDPSDRYQTAEELIGDLEMLRIDRAVDTGDLPSTRSQIISVINAEKERIDQLERQLSATKQVRIMLLILAIAGWGLAAVIWFMKPGT